MVCGGRDYRDMERVTDTLDFLEPTTVITGNAGGADNMAECWADVRGTPTHLFPAQWNLYGRAAGPIRNQQMLDEGKPDMVVAFPGGTGTADMVRRAKKAGVKVLEIQP